MFTPFNTSNAYEDRLPLAAFPLIDNSNVYSKQERTKLWELDHNYHCAVIGTCLTLDEVKKLLRSFKIPITNLNSYELHTSIVTIISYHDFRSKKVQNYLNKKFKLILNKTKKMGSNELIQEWKKAVNTGDLIATFWAVIAHPCTTEQMKRDFYGDIHMQSHMSGSSNRVDLKRLHFLESERKQQDKNNRCLQNNYQDLQAENACLQQKIQQQNEISADLNNKVQALNNANEQLSILKGVEEKQQLNTLIIKLKYRNNFQSDEIALLEKKLIASQAATSHLKHQNNLSRQEIAEYQKEASHLQSILNQEKTEKSCLFNEQGLCGQCVLYVGGKTNLIPFYRKMVEAKEGVFLHHDGGIEKSTQNLSSSLSRADVIIFPSDCLSHDAYWKIKSICKKQQKPFKYLKSPGLHSLTKLLNTLIVPSEEKSYS